MYKKHKNFCRVLNYIQHLLVLISTVTGSVSVPDFASLVCIPIEITSSEVVLKASVITAEIKKCKLLMEKKKK